MVSNFRSTFAPNNNKMKQIFLLSLSILFFASSCKKEPLVDTSLNNIPDMSDLGQLQEATKEGVSMLFFHNTWCKNCEEIRPTVEAVSEDPQFEDVYFAEIEFDNNKAIANYYVVKGFPTLVFLKDGVEKIRLEGKNHTREAIENRIKSLM